MISKLYSEDWFGRTNGGYTFDESEMHHGIVKIDNHKYSSFLYNEDKAERICSDPELLKKEMTDMIHAVGLSNIAFKLSETCETAQTNGSYIEIGIGKDYKNISDCYEKLDRVIAMTLHESCHCLYTDFNYIHKVCEKYPSIVHHIHNVIEDEIIEQKLCLAYPGYENFLAKLKYNMFDKHSDDAEEPETDLQEVMQIFFFLVRYPKYIANIDEDILGKHENTIASIKKIMKDTNCFVTDNPNPTKCSTDAAVKIYELLVGEFCSDTEEGSGCPGEKGEESKNGHGNSDNESEANGSENGSDNGENEGEDNGNSGSSMSGITIENEAPDTEESNDDTDWGDIVAILSKILEDISSESEMTDIKDLTIYHSDIEDKVRSFHNFEWKECKDTRIDYNEINVWKNENIMRYKTYMREVSPYIETAKSLIINNRTIQNFNVTRFTRNGSLDPTRLANAMCNEQTVYTRRTVETKNMDAEYALVIMLDESGSMEDHGINILASKIAIMLYEAVRNYPKIKLFVYGHGDCVYKYIDTDECKNKYVLGARRSQGGQDEVRSYKLIVDDVKKYTKLPIVMFNITDSCYCSNENRLANLVHELRDDKTQPTYINLICLGHNDNVNNSVKGWNDIIYGEGNWVLYNKFYFSTEWVNTIKKIATIIHRTVKLK